jgi:hypothetical protein
MSLIERVEAASNLMREAAVKIVQLRSLADSQEFRAELAEARLAKAEAAIKAAVEYSGNRASEWGERAETCFQFLHDYLDKTGAQKQGESIDAFCERTQPEEQFEALKQALKDR